MRYRIKIRTYKNGRKTYEAQYKTIIGWLTLGFKGNANIYNKGFNTENKEWVLEAIDLHYQGNSKLQIIEIEYITKN